MMLSDASVRLYMMVSRLDLPARRRRELFGPYCYGEDKSKTLFTMKRRHLWSSIRKPARPAVLRILAEGAIALSVTLSGGALFAS